MPGHWRAACPVSCSRLCFSTFWTDKTEEAAYGMLELTWKRNPHFVHKERIVFRLGHCCGEIFFLSVMFDTWGKTAGLSILESLQNEMGCWGIWTVLYGWKGQLFPLSLMEEWQGLSSCVPVSSWKGLGEAEGMAEMRPVVLTNVM